MSGIFYISSNSGLFNNYNQQMQQSQYNSYSYLQQAQQAYQQQSDINQYIPKTENKEYLRQLFHYLSEEDSKKIVALLVEYMKNDDREIKLSEAVETCILNFFIDKHC